MTKDYEKPEDRVKKLFSEAEKRPSNVTDFFAAAKKLGRSLDSPPPKAINITGNNSAGVIGNYNQVNINVKTSPGKVPTVNIQPGPEHISDSQAAEIKELVNKVVIVTGQQHAFVWSTLKRRFRFTKYQLITHDKYEVVRQYLKGWIVSNGQTNLDQNSDAMRKRILARIHAEAKKQNGLLDQIYAYIQGRFGVDGLSELTVGQLNEVIRKYGF